TVSGLAQKKMRVPEREAASEELGEEDEDNPLAREQWFRQGRTVTGASAAALRYRAYQPKMAARARRLSHRTSSANTPSGTSASIITPLAAVAGGSGPVWQSLGPAPSASDPTGFQDYGGVTGRVTVIAVDQHDATGNTVYIGGAFGGVWRST